MIELEADEHIILEVRKHMLAFFLETTGTAFAALVPLIAYQVYEAFFVKVMPENASLIFAFIYIIWLTILWIFTFVAWTRYFLDVWIITNKRVVDFEMRALFSRDIASVKIENIQDVKINITGILNTFLKIGDVHIQTSGSDKEFILKQAHNPEQAKMAIMKVSSGNQSPQTTP